MAKKVKRNSQLQGFMHIIGALVMLFCFICLLPILNATDRHPTDDQTLVHGYLIIVPIVFLLAFCLFLLPILWEGRGKISQFIIGILGYGLWAHLDRIAFMFYLLAPMVIGYTTFSMQSSIYYDADTLIVYLLGDLLIIYILSLLAVAAIENQIGTLNAWLENTVFGSNNKYSVLVVED